jgi:hypothetical protein
MSLTAEQKHLLNNATPGLAKVKLGDMLDDATEAKPGLVKQGAAVAVAAGANPTKAEFDALVLSLRTSGAIATA